MAKKPSKDEIVEIFYGINTKTFAVESVSRTRGGVLSGGNNFIHRIHPAAASPASEVGLVYNLTEITSVPAIFWNADSTKKLREELDAKAAEMKKKAGEKSSDA